MATMTRKPKAPARHVATLVLIIDGRTGYKCRPIKSDWHARAWRLRKADGTVYHVARGEHGTECDCPDATYRDRPCKHARALAAAGLL